MRPGRHRQRMPQRWYEGYLRSPSLVAGVIFAGACLAFYVLGNGTERRLIVPVLIAAACAGYLILAVHRSESLSESRMVGFGLLLAAIFLALNTYEVLLYDLSLCGGEWENYPFLPPAAPRQAYCNLVGHIGYWPAYIPTVAVVLATTAALERGVRPLIVASLGALIWSLVFVFLPLAFPTS